MPAKSKAQQRLMAAAEHGAQFPMADQLRQTMTHQQLHDYASGPMTGKPAHVTPTKAGAFGKAGAPHPHKNLGAYLHPPKKGR